MEQDCTISLNTRNPVVKGGVESLVDHYYLSWINLSEIPIVTRTGTGFLKQAAQFEPKRIEESASAFALVSNCYL